MTSPTIEGRALTRLASRAGLAPPYVLGDKVDTGYDDPCFWVVDHWEPWEPHVNLSQAEAVFRQLRDLGWVTQLSYHPVTGMGTVHALEGPVIVGRKITCHFGRGCGDSEALALLRCAVLAVCSTGSAGELREGFII